MRTLSSAAVLCSFALVLGSSSLHAQAVKTGEAAFETFTDEQPGNRVHITVADLPTPHPEQSVANGPTLVPRNGAVPIAKPG